MGTWFTPAKDGNKFNTLTLRGDSDLGFSSAIAVKGDENSYTIYAFVTSCNAENKDKDFKFEPCLCKMNVYLKDHTDRYENKREVTPLMAMLTDAIESIDGFNAYFSGYVSPVSTKAFSAWSTGVDHKSQPINEEMKATLLKSCADLEVIEGKGELEGVELPAAGMGFQRKSFTQSQILDQRIDWMIEQLKPDSKLEQLGKGICEADSFVIDTLNALVLELF